MKRSSRVLAWIMLAVMLIAAVPSAVEAASNKVNTKRYVLTQKGGVYPAAFTVKLKAKKGYKVYFTINDKYSAKNVIKSGKTKVFTIDKFTVLKVYAVKKSKKMTTKKLKAKQAKYVPYTYAISEYPDFNEIYGDSIGKTFAKAVTEDKREFMGEDIKVLAAVPLKDSKGVRVRFFQNEDGTVDVFGKVFLVGFAVDQYKYVEKSSSITIAKVKLKKNSDDEYEAVSVDWQQDGVNSLTSLYQMCVNRPGLAQKLIDIPQKSIDKQVQALLIRYNKLNNITNITVYEATNEKLYKLD